MLEGKNKYIMEKEVKEWRLKSQAIWLAERNKNPKFFHNHSIHINNVNTIWEISEADGCYLVASRRIYRR